MARRGEADSRPLSVLIAGGGTGGHLFPGLAVARELVRREPQARVVFVGTARGLEASVVPQEGFALETIRSAGLKGQALAGLVRGLLLLPASALYAWRVLSRRAPHLVIGVGGYSSGPVVLLAALRGVPTLVLEQNAAPGFTNRRLAPVVRAAAVTYEATLPFFRGRGFVSGNPVRPEFFEGGGDELQAPRADAAARVLVFGGSQGAHAINVAMVAAAPELAAGGRPLSIVHQTGPRDLETVRDAYRRAGLDARVEGFLGAMAREMREADVIVCRAGATTLAELAAVGRAAILIPLPGAADDHQRRNAEVLEAARAVERLDEGDLTGPRLAAQILALVADPPRRAALAASLGRFAHPDAARLIVDRALALAGRPGRA